MSQLEPEGWRDTRSVHAQRLAHEKKLKERIRELEEANLQLTSIANNLIKLLEVAK